MSCLKECGRLEPIAILQTPICKVGGPSDVDTSFLCIANKAVPYSGSYEPMRSQGRVEAIDIAEDWLKVISTED